MKDFIEESGLAILTIIGVIITLWVICLMCVFLPAERVCLDAGYLNTVITFDYDVYCQSLTGTVPLNEVLNE